MTPAEASKGSPLVDPNAPPLPRYFALDPAATEGAADVIAAPQRRRRVDHAARVHQQSVQGTGAGRTPAKGDFATTHVGDEWDTSPFPNTTVSGNFDGDVHPADDDADQGAGGDAGRARHAASQSRGAWTI